MNIGRVFSEPIADDATARIDLLQVAIHEIGHALGLDDAYSGYAEQFLEEQHAIPITPPRPFAGSVVGINPAGPHIADSAGKPLMIFSPTPGLRQLISSLDALLLAQLSSFKQPDLSDPPLDRNGQGQGFVRPLTAPAFSCNFNNTDTGPW